MMQWKDLKLWCPKCNKWVHVQAEAYNVDMVRAPLMYYVHRGEPGDVSIDWENIEVEADYNYVCSEMGCDHVFGSGYMDDLMEKLKEDIRVHGDPDKAEEHMPV